MNLPSPVSIPIIIYPPTPAQSVGNYETPPSFHRKILLPSRALSHSFSRWQAQRVATATQGTKETATELSWLPNDRTATGNGTKKRTLQAGCGKVLVFDLSSEVPNWYIDFVQTAVPCLLCQYASHSMQMTVAIVVRCFKLYIAQKVVGVRPYQR